MALRKFFNVGVHMLQVDAITMTLLMKDLKRFFEKGTLVDVRLVSS